MNYPVIKSDGEILFPIITENNNKYFMHNWCHTISEANTETSTGKFIRENKPVETLFITRNDTSSVSVISLPTDKKYSHQELKDLVNNGSVPMGYSTKNDKFLNAKTYMFLQDDYVEQNGINDNQQILQFTF